MSRRGAVGSCLVVGAMVCGGSARHPNFGPVPPGWPGFAHNPMHWAQPRVSAQPLVRIKWSTPVDQNPSGGAHYGTPLLTRANTVVFPVRNGNGSYHVEAREPAAGAVKWTLSTGYDPPSSGWTPACGATLTPNGGVAIPDSGGRVLIRVNADAAASATRELIFYGAANYNANPAGFNDTVRINTPITADASGNLYFGVAVSGTPPLNTLRGGIVRVTPSGQGTWVSASAAANDSSITRCQHNCAPALTADGKTLYAGVRGMGGGGYLVALDSTTLATLHRVRCRDPQLNQDADMTDFSTASPVVAPDGQVYFGVLDPFLNNNDRGWLLHYSADLSQTRTPGAFGWDNTPSIVPASSVGGYQGSSPYLLMCKYNNYAGIGTGDGLNKIAILDPNDTQVDPVTGVTIMKEVITKLAPTPDPANPGGFREWCINNTAIDAAGHAAMVNNEDGKLYRWNLDTNTLEQAIMMTGGTSEAYTPTVIGPDGTVYAVNAATLFAVGQ